jgi:hypothetical protein
MKILQSFWSCDKSLLKNSFGWLSPQHHLMAWTLSCLKLHEHYEDLNLYTDTNGYEIFIKQLKLPYKTVQTTYDHIHKKHENNFAIAKMMTYAAQHEPFIHVDGDVFIWDRFNSELENAELIVQNLETGTTYYRHLMDALKQELTYLPDFLEEEMNKVSIPSVNAGILGGNDIAFLNRYANAGLNLIEKNCPDEEKCNLSGNFNILFEQILFYALSNKENKKIGYLFDETFEDYGYSKAQFADLSSVPQRHTYLHLIGGKKRDSEICELMSRTLFQQYPEYFYRIICLFKNEHLYFHTRIKTFLPESWDDHPKIVSEENGPVKYSPYHRTKQAIGEDHQPNKNLTIHQLHDLVEKFATVELKEVFQYEKQLAALTHSWQNISTGYLYALEGIPANHFELYFQLNELQQNTILQKNPYLVIIEDSFSWTSETKNRINPYLISKNKDETLGLACMPQLFFNGHNEVIIDELEYNILTLLERPVPLKDLVQEIGSILSDGEVIIYKLTLIKLKRLFLNKCIFI